MHKNYGKEERLRSNMSKYLEANSTSKEKIKNLASLISMSIKVFALVIHAKGRLIDATI